MIAERCPRKARANGVPCERPLLRLRPLTIPMKKRDQTLKSVPFPLKIRMNDTLPVYSRSSKNKKRLPSIAPQRVSSPCSRSNRESFLERSVHTIPKMHQEVPMINDISSKQAVPGTGIIHAPAMAEQSKCSLRTLFQESSAIGQGTHLVLEK